MSVMGRGSRRIGGAAGADTGAAGGASTAPQTATGAAATTATADPRNPAKKGRPTPRRRDQERARGLHTGPVTAPLTRAEAKERRRSAEAGMSKEEKKASRAAARRDREERRQLMMEGDDRYVLSRDKGEVRRFARDWVDVRRRPINLFMPLALVVFVLSVVRIPALELASQVGFLAFLLIIVVDGLLISRGVNAAVRERFPEAEGHAGATSGKRGRSGAGDAPSETGFGLGWYAAMRATQPRVLRTPKPRVRPGQAL